MSEAIFKTSGGSEYRVTRDQILQAMITFDKDFRGREGVPDTGQGWFILEKEKKYPPKWIMSLAVGVPRGQFKGGGPTNKPLRDLGFDVQEVEEDIEDESKIERSIEAIKTTFTIERDLQAALRSQIGQL